MTDQPPRWRAAEVSFRFYGQLNDFLAPPLRGRRFTHLLRGPASVKDAIESLGVPHPEVDLMVVNGGAEDFSYRLRDADDVAVYPRFRSIDLGDLRRAGIDPPRPVRFALDVHLGKLAALLRLAGFDAVLREDDRAIADLAAQEGRVVLTRDVGLLKRSVVRWGYWVRQTDSEAQLIEVLGRFDLVEHMAPFTRCLSCNSLVVPADPGAVADRILPRTRAVMRQFHRCPSCDRIYWKGSHYDRLVRLLARVRERVAVDLPA